MESKASAVSPLTFSETSNHHIRGLSSSLKLTHYPHDSDPGPPAVSPEGSN